MKHMMVATFCVLGLAAKASAAVFHDYSAVLGTGVEGIALNNACVTETEVKSIRPVKVCTHLVATEVAARGDAEATHTDWTCQSYTQKMLTSPRGFIRTVCVTVDNRGDAGDGSCLEWAKEADFLPNTINITTVTRPAGTWKDNFPGVVSQFTFPACK